MKWVGDGVLKIGDQYFGQDGAVYDKHGVLLKETWQDIPIDKLSPKQRDILIDRNELVEGSFKKKAELKPKKKGK